MHGFLWEVPSRRFSTMIEVNIPRIYNPGLSVVGKNDSILPEFMTVFSSSTPRTKLNNAGHSQMVKNVVTFVQYVEDFQ